MRHRALTLAPRPPIVGPGNVPLYGVHPVVWVEALAGQASEPSWRVLEAQSLDGRAFRLELTWSAGDGQSRPVTVAWSRGGRVSLYARTVTVRAANLCDAVNRVDIRIASAESPIDTANVDALEATIDPALNLLELPLSELARRVRFDWDPTSFGVGLSRPYARLYDGMGVQIWNQPLADQPDDGWPLAGAQRLVIAGVPAVTNPPARAGYVRTVFELAV